MAVALAVVGLYFLCITDGFSLGKGDIYIFLCAVVYTMHILVIDHFAPKTDNVKMSCIQFMVVGVLSVPFMMILETVTFDAVIKTAGPILCAGVMSSGIYSSDHWTERYESGSGVIDLKPGIQHFRTFRMGAPRADADSKRRNWLCVDVCGNHTCTDSDQKYRKKMYRQLR